MGGILPIGVEGSRVIYLWIINITNIVNFDLLVYKALFILLTPNSVMMFADLDDQNPLQLPMDMYGNIAQIYSTASLVRPRNITSLIGQEVYPAAPPM
ncbi:hypothetical protein BU24DRAFT_165708 [Aaosphaeria arxii CBS 175.79]|uniref:Uncharacterized protein n=1 Tax=Aaosphaeria arxii CBS 175.79 TaxID=1450172 RepID=A0A6A5XYT9_9PLEO|nr:uncharacterized protein BU24DRAFT_165708 [Aaosphaeria arxii CBS 175.79]KAF2018146.1 hypothetical protein BU24DRAFT_165708 [Aaosphaeria arxii CBS 175.79]